MSGQAPDNRFGRGRVGPLQAVLPTRLPGGIWGPPAATGTVTWDANGGPIAGFGLVPASAATLGQTEWPIPCRWEVQANLSLTKLSGPGGTTFPATGLAFRPHIQIVSSVESAAGLDEYELRWGAGLYPSHNANHQLGQVQPFWQTWVFSAQTLRFRLDRIEGGINANLAGQTWGWSISILPCLTSAGWPAP